MNDIYVPKDPALLHGLKIANNEDVVEVVRCKDCRHYDKGACWGQAAYGRCWREDDYCSYGERRK